MKMSPEYTKAQANMQPGVITSDGFLGDDDRPIVEIIQSDEVTMKKLDLDFDEAAELMESLMEKGRKGLGEPVTVDEKWLVQVSEARGFLASPFEDGIFRKVNVTVSRKALPGKELLYSALSLHLFRKYHFLQGSGSPFRLEPQEIKEILDL
jgi:hypothetical protein